MTIEQTVEIPADRQLHLDLSLPETAQARGMATVLVQFPSQAEASDQVAEKDKGEYSADWKETLAVLKRTRGAWAANPWENAMEDIRAMRDEWGHRDFWNPDSAKQHRD
ncbi:MAG: hypothetical protein LBT39_04190 [Treponema sp.]|nr:hypothetical protein [Treponema sp.]